jgi:hypothetical protein
MVFILAYCKVNKNIVINFEYLQGAKKIETYEKLIWY